MYTACALFLKRSCEIKHEGIYRLKVLTRSPAELEVVGRTLQVASGRGALKYDARAHAHFLAVVKLKGPRISNRLLLQQYSTSNMMYSALLASIFSRVLCTSNIMIRFCVKQCFVIPTSVLRVRQFGCHDNKHAATI